MYIHCTRTYLIPSKICYYIKHKKNILHPLHIVIILSYTINHYNTFLNNHLFVYLLLIQ